MFKLSIIGTAFDKIALRNRTFPTVTHRKCNMPEGDTICQLQRQNSYSEVVLLIIPKKETQMPKEEQ